MKILPASVLAVASLLISLAPAAAAEHMVAIYAGPSGISIPVSALAPAPVQPNPETASAVLRGQPLTTDEADETRAPLAIREYTASASLR